MTATQFTQSAPVNEVKDVMFLIACAIEDGNPEEAWGLRFTLNQSRYVLNPLALALDANPALKRALANLDVQLEKLELQLEPIPA